MAVARMLLAQNWRSELILETDEWVIKLFQLIELDKLTKN